MSREKISYENLRKSNSHANKEITEDIELNVDMSFSFDNCKFKKIKIIHAPSLTFTNKCECDEIEIVPGASGILSLMNSSVYGTLSLKSALDYIILDNSNIGNLEVDYKGHFPSFNIDYCTFQKLSLLNIARHEKQTVKFTLCLVNENMSVRNSILDDIGFDGLDLSKAELSILNSSITEANYYSITWPKDSKIIEEIDSKGINELDESDLLKLREVYRQLKVVAIDSHNKLDAKKFLTNELRIYYRQIHVRTFGNKFQLKDFVKIVTSTILLPIVPLIIGAQTIFLYATRKPEQKREKIIEKSKSYFSNVADLFILWTNKTFSNFGESLLQPLYFLTITQLIFFYFFMDDLKIAKEVSFVNYSWDSTLKVLGYFLNFLSPAHSSTVNDFYGKELSLFGTADFFMRISSAYFIFYFLRATRKFNFNV